MNRPDPNTKSVQIGTELVRPDRPDIEAIQQRAEAATRGPWIAAPTESPGNHTIDSENSPYGIVTVWDAQEDIVKPAATAAFIAHARTDVPALCDYAEAMEARVKELEEQRDHPGFATNPGALGRRA
ncbi:hypothetical protein LCGC14_1030550 [marine sediment metagenome]|uniref:Uncharacterized protein n=1 Tax=marine sediment metagenome TaxID=412755 RepID=A0A0F9QCR6_9ZZZZ